MLGKIQKFLKSKHKFDKKLSWEDQFEILTNDYNNLKESAQNDDQQQIREALVQLLVELIKFSNTKDIQLEELLKTDFNLNI